MFSALCFTHPLGGAGSAEASGQAVWGGRRSRAVLRESCPSHTREALRSEGCARAARWVAGQPRPQRSWTPGTRFGRAWLCLRTGRPDAASRACQCNLIKTLSYEFHNFLVIVERYKFNCSTSERQREEDAQRVVMHTIDRCERRARREWASRGQWWASPRGKCCSGLLRSSSSHSRSRRGTGPISARVMWSVDSNKFSS